MLLDSRSYTTTSSPTSHALNDTFGQKHQPRFPVFPQPGTHFDEASQTNIHGYLTGNLTMDAGISTSPGEGITSFEPYSSAIILANLSLLFTLLIIPPMLWHFSNRNIGATSLVLWLLVLNLQGFLNAIIWSSDDTEHWFEGYVLCDIEVKIMVAVGVGVPSSVACVLRALAKVMDTERVSMGLTKSQRRRVVAVDLLWCAGFPALQMLFHYIVQTTRYYIVGIAGCTPAASRSWLTDLLIVAPPVVWTVIGGYCAGELVS